MPQSEFEIERYAKLIKQYKLTWTTEKPTKPGWYWARWQLVDGSYYPARVMEVVKNHHDELAVIVPDYDGLRVEGTIDLLGRCDFTEWAGPLEPPT